MGDIDFDELDRAVNSLMGSTPKPDPDDQPKQKTLTINTTLKPGEKPAYDKLEEVAKKIGSETLETDSSRMRVADLTSLSQQVTDRVSRAEPSQGSQSSHRVRVPQRPPRGGRFMDVVHPSSDMKTAPQSPSVTEAADTPVEEPEAAGAEYKVAVTRTEPSKDTDTAQVMSGPDMTQLTPFLPDAKVQKRPLGGGTSYEESVTPAPGDDTNPAEEKALEIAEIESINSERVKDTKDGDSQRPLDPVDFDAKPSAEEEQLKSIESSDTEVSSPVTSESVRAVESGDTGSVVAGGDSQVEVSDDKGQEDTNGHIYDVGDYHQTLGHPVKQKSGWGTVAIIIIIILVCAGAGAAYYFLGMNT